MITCHKLWKWLCQLILVTLWKAKSHICINGNLQIMAQFYWRLLFWQWNYHKSVLATDGQEQSQEGNGLRLEKVVLTFQGVSLWLKQSLKVNYGLSHPVEIKFFLLPPSRMDLMPSSWYERSICAGKRAIDGFHVTSSRHVAGHKQKISPKLLLIVPPAWLPGLC